MTYIIDSRVGHCLNGLVNVFLYYEKTLIYSKLYQNPVCTKIHKQNTNNVLFQCCCNSLKFPPTSKYQNIFGKQENCISCKYGFAAATSHLGYTKANPCTHCKGQDSKPPHMVHTISDAQSLRPISF